ncbi:MAG TPA: LITAF-like zinc ribbon domain-containing protein [Pyrinomonadaceae bacterium]|nr:LITAF-like zinc ribbon domain-containing protein [Pyrinomonadaceae bacterium]
MSTIFCHQCGQPNADIARICRYCGQALSADSQTVPPAYAPPRPSSFTGTPLWNTDAPPAPVQPLAQGFAPAAAPTHFRCPHCQSTAPPIVAKRIGTAGWVVFFALLIACFPLCFIGLFIKEEYRMCSWCRGAIA